MLECRVWRSHVKSLEPILQDTMVKEKEHREAHLHEIRFAATCVGQLVGKEGLKRVFLDA